MNKVPFASDPQVLASRVGKLAIHVLRAPFLPNLCMRKEIALNPGKHARTDRAQTAARRITNGKPDIFNAMMD